MTLWNGHGSGEDTHREDTRAGACRSLSKASALVPRRVSLGHVAAISLRTPSGPSASKPCFQDTECKIRSVLEVVLDSDGVGYVQKIRSTTGVVVTRGSHLLRHSAVLQSSIGLSSAEAKCCALLRDACLVLGVQSYFTDWRPHIEN